MSQGEENLPSVTELVNRQTSNEVVIIDKPNEDLNQETEEAQPSETPSEPPEVPPHKTSTENSESSAKEGAGAKKPRSRHRNKRYTHNEKRYHSEVRQEAVQQALAAMQSEKNVPMPSKRSSVMPQTNQDEDTDVSSSDGESDVPQAAAAAAISDTSSNCSLPAPTTAPPPLPTPAEEVQEEETPPLLPRGASQAGPSRPLPASPARQMSMPEDSSTRNDRRREQQQRHQRDQRKRREKEHQSRGAQALAAAGSLDDEYAISVKNQRSQTRHASSERSRQPSNDQPTTEQLMAVNQENLEPCKLFPFKSTNISIAFLFQMMSCSWANNSSRWKDLNKYRLRMSRCKANWFNIVCDQPQITTGHTTNTGTKSSRDLSPSSTQCHTTLKSLDCPTWAQADRHPITTAKWEPCRGGKYRLKFNSYSIRWRSRGNDIWPSSTRTTMSNLRLLPIPKILTLPRLKAVRWHLLLERNW